MKITFDKLYINLVEVTAYQTDPACKSGTGQKPKAKEKIIEYRMVAVCLLVELVGPFLLLPPLGKERSLRLRALPLLLFFCIVFERLNVLI